MREGKFHAVVSTYISRRYWNEQMMRVSAIVLLQIVVQRGHIAATVVLRAILIVMNGDG